MKKKRIQPGLNEKRRKRKSQTSSPVSGIQHAATHGDPGTDPETPFSTEELFQLGRVFGYLHGFQMEGSPRIRALWKGLFGGDNQILQFCRFYSLMTKLIRQLALTGVKEAVAESWNCSADLITLIHDLAYTKPDALKPIARRALFLPSIRAKVKRFTYDFHEIQDRISLSKDCIIDTSSAALSDLDSEATFLVATLLDSLGRTRDEMKRQEQEWKRYRAAGRTTCTLEEWLAVESGCEGYALALRTLPEFSKGTADLWWTTAIKPVLARRDFFETFQHSAHYQRLYHRLCRTAKSPKSYDVMDKLREQCRPKVKALAPAVPPRSPTI